MEETQVTNTVALYWRVKTIHTLLPKWNMTKVTHIEIEGTTSDKSNTIFYTSNKCKMTTSYTSYKWNGTKVTHFVIKCQVTKATSFVDICMQWQKLKFVDKNEKQPMLNTWWRKWKITKVNKGDTSDKGQTLNSLRHRRKVPKITQSVIQVKSDKIKKKIFTCSSHWAMQKNLWGRASP